MRPAQFNNKGFTLIELLVAVAVSSILLTAILTLFTNSQINYNVQEDVADMQQNVRAAKMFLERDIRMTGSGIMNLQGPNLSPIQPLWFSNGGTGGTDRLTLMYELPDSNPCGTAPTSPATILCNDLPTLTLAANVTETAAVAEVKENLSSTWASSICSCNNTVYNLGSGDMIPFIVSTPDKSLSSILVATGTASDYKLSNGPNVSYGQIPGADILYDFIGETSTTTLENKQLNNFPTGSKISFFTPGNIYEATYFVADDDNGISSLQRDLNDGSAPEVIAEYIDDFQCSFTLADGTVINDRDLTAAEIPNVRLVTITILGRSPHPHIQGIGRFEGKREQVEDRLAAATNDNFRRRKIESTIMVRNFGLN